MASTPNDIAALGLISRPRRQILYTPGRIYKVSCEVLSRSRYLVVEISSTRRVREAHRYRSSIGE